MGHELGDGGDVKFAPGRAARRERSARDLAPPALPATAGHSTARKGRAPWRAAGGAPLLISVLLAGGCQGPRVVVERDPGAGETRFEVGPISLGALCELRLSATLPLRRPPPRDETWILARFSWIDFSRAIILADGERFAYQRARFHERAFRIPLGELERIASAGRIAIRFDSDDPGDDARSLDAEARRRLEEFTTRLLQSYEQARVATWREEGELPPR